MESLICLVAIILLMGVAFISAGVRVVPEYQRLVVFRLGRALRRAMGPGIVFLIPTIDRAVKVDLHELKHEVPVQTANTKDSKSVTFMFSWSSKVLDPIESVVAIGNYPLAGTGVAAAQFRELLREVNSADLFSEREHIRSKVHARLDEITKRWGVRVTALEIIQMNVDDHKS